MNIYSDAYVPQWLQDVNTAIGTTRRSLDIEPLECQRLRYIQSFSGTEVWQSSPKSSYNNTSVDPLAFEEHIAQITDFVDQEWSAKLIRAKSWNRFKVKIEPFGFPVNRPRPAHLEHNDASRLYWCTVPGIQEFTPLANIGDVR